MVIAGRVDLAGQGSAVATASRKAVEGEAPAADIEECFVPAAETGYLSGSPARRLTLVQIDAVENFVGGNVVEQTAVKQKGLAEWQERIRADHQAELRSFETAVHCASARQHFGGTMGPK